MGESSKLSPTKIAGIVGAGVIAVLLATAGVSTVKNNSTDPGAETSNIIKEESTETGTENTDIIRTGKGIIVSGINAAKPEEESSNKPTTIMGADGLNGQDGKDGIDGKDGADGTNGLDGANGKDGKNGATGATGASGRNGTDSTGTKGSDGINGTNGKDGSNGANGKSAFTYAVEGGYTGTESELSSTLATAQGKIDEATKIAEKAAKSNVTGAYASSGNGTGVLSITINDDNE